MRALGLSPFCIECIEESEVIYVANLSATLLTGLCPGSCLLVLLVDLK